MRRRMYYIGRFLPAFIIIIVFITIVGSRLSATLYYCLNNALLLLPAVLGCCLVRLCGEIDFSCGGQFVCSYLLFRWLYGSLGVPVAIAAVIVLLTALLIGSTYGMLHSRAGINYLLMTLIGQTVFISFSAFLMKATISNIKGLESYATIIVYTDLFIGICCLLFLTKTAVGRSVSVLSTINEPLPFELMDTGYVKTVVSCMAAVLFSISGILLFLKVGATASSFSPNYHSYRIIIAAGICGYGAGRKGLAPISAIAGSIVCFMVEFILQHYNWDLSLFTVICGATLIVSEAIKNNRHA